MDASPGATDEVLVTTYTGGKHSNLSSRLMQGRGGEASELLRLIDIGKDSLGSLLDFLRSVPSVAAYSGMSA